MTSPTTPDRIGRHEIERQVVQRDWISALQRGEDPFTPEVLAGLVM